MDESLAPSHVPLLVRVREEAGREGGRVVASDWSAPYAVSASSHHGDETSAGREGAGGVGEGPAAAPLGLVWSADSAGKSVRLSAGLR